MDSIKTLICHWAEIISYSLTLRLFLPSAASLDFPMSPQPLVWQHRLPLSATPVWQRSQLSQERLIDMRYHGLLFLTLFCLGLSSDLNPAGRARNTASRAGARAGSRHRLDLQGIQRQRIRGWLLQPELQRAVEPLFAVAGAEHHGEQDESQQRLRLVFV